MTVIVSPDVELAVLTYLRSVAPVTALVATMGTELPTTPPARFVTVTTLPTSPSPVPVWVAAGRVQVDAWAATRADASLIARTIRGALIAGRNVYTPAGRIAGFRLVLEPAWTPDTSRTPPTPRFSMTVDVVTHP